MYLTRHTQPSRQAGILVVLHCNRQCHVFWSALVHCSERSPFPLTQSFTEKKYTHTNHPPPPIRIEMLTSYFIFYTGDFLSSACFSIRCCYCCLDASFVCICGTNILLIQCCMNGGGGVVVVIVLCYYFARQTSCNDVATCVLACLLVCLFLFIHDICCLLLDSFFLSCSILFSSTGLFMPTLSFEIFNGTKQRNKMQHKSLREKVICSLIDIYPVRRHHKWLAICW